MDTKDRIVSDNEGEIRRKKLEDVVDMLVLYEAMNAIFIHDKDSHVALSPFSEILVFADNSQEWDRFECKNGEPIDYAKDKIKICVDNCDGQETTLSFYEETSFEQTEPLNNIIPKLSSILNDATKKGAFGLFFYLKVESPNMNPQQAFFRCRHHPKVFDKRELPSRKGEIHIKDFCESCGKKRGG